jgi:hypothetical protein
MELLAGTNGGARELSRAKTVQRRAVKAGRVYNVDPPAEA